MDKKYEITIRELVPYTPEEETDTKIRGNKFDTYPSNRYSDKNFHETRVLFAELSKEEFEAIKKAVIGVI